MSDWERVHRGGHYYYVKRDKYGRIIAQRKTAPGRSEECFVVSATFCNENIIQFYRNYRDEVLIQNRVGRLLVDLYYIIGPTLATIVRKSLVIKILCTKFLKKLKNSLSG
jgi:hypothetical protein